MHENVIIETDKNMLVIIQWFSDYEYVLNKITCIIFCILSVVILLDLSQSNVNYLVHVQHSVRLLLEQQLANKEGFNIVG